MAAAATNTQTFGNMTTNPYIALHLAITAGLWLMIFALITK